MFSFIVGLYARLLSVDYRVTLYKVELWIKPSRKQRVDTVNSIFHVHSPRVCFDVKKKEVYISPNFYQVSGARRKDNSEKFVAVWDNRFLENVKLCSERIPGGYVEISRATLES